MKAMMHGIPWPTLSNIGTSSDMASWELCLCLYPRAEAEYQSHQVVTGGFCRKSDRTERPVADIEVRFKSLRTSGVVRMRLVGYQFMNSTARKPNFRIHSRYAKLATAG